MLSPKKVKYRKTHLRSLRKKAKGGASVAFGRWGLKAAASCFITARQIEAARIAMTRHMKRGGKVWIRIFPDLAVTKKPAETRMGSGKGSPEYWVARVEKGRVLFEVDGVSEQVAREALCLASHKLPVPTRVVRKQ